MCHRKRERTRTANSATDDEREDAPGWWGAGAADRLRTLVASERDGEEAGERPAPDAEPTAAEDDADGEREKTELIPAGD